MRDLPTGVVTLLFTDVEGSTRLLAELGAEGYAAVLAEHRQLLRQAFSAEGGVEVDTQGDAFFFAFEAAPAAVRAAAAARESLVAGAVRVRMGLHSGRPLLAEEGYVGHDVHLAARIAAAGHGGQVLLSAATRERCDDEVTDLGEHRLKDFPQPVRIFQLGSETFPPLKTISNTNLPRPVSSFVGRERELREVLALLGEARLLTLSGPGGTGKTRLAIEAAAELVGEHKAGVFWVGLAALQDHALVLEEIGHTLGAKGPLAEHVGQRVMLLLLDNFEQVVAAAPELTGLLESCPNLRILVTSRERLRVRGEVEYSVPPLSEAEAVELFCRRSGLAADQSVGELCRRLDQLPLALELAAARTGVLTPTQILERLGGRLDLLRGGRDAEARQRTLRATMEWSYELLDEPERQLFGRLGVFSGGCTLVAAEVVAAAELDVLQSLVDKSLIRHDADRFWMLEVIRAFAAERLEASGEADSIRARHCEHYLALAEEAFPRLLGRPGEWLDKLEVEHENLRAACDLALAMGQPRTALRFGAALYRFWYMKGHLIEAGQRLDAALEADLEPSLARARALNGAAVAALNTGQPGRARALALEALQHHQRFGDHWGAAYATFMLGMADAEEGDYAAGERLMADCVERFRLLGDDHYALVAMDNRAYFLTELGQLGLARTLHESELPVARAAGNERIESMALGGLAAIDLEEGHGAEALRRLEGSLAIHARHGDRQMIARELRRSARALAMIGRPEDATRLLALSEALRVQVSANEGSFEAFNRGTLELIRGQLATADFERCWEEGSHLSIDQAAELAFRSPGPGPPTG